MPSRHNLASRRIRTATALAVDGLEARLCMASSASLLADGTLLILGDNRADRFEIVDGGSGTVGVIGRFDDFGSGAYEDVEGEFDALFDGVTRIEVVTRGGSDLVHYRLTDPLVTSQALDLNLGSGNDRVVIDVGMVSDADLYIYAVLGSGNDQFDMAFFGDLIDSYVQVDVLGGAGNDDLVIASEVIALDESTLDMFLDGGAGRDQVEVEMDLDELAFGLLNIDARGGSGNDFVGLEIYGVGGLSTDSLLIADGGPGRDRFSVTPEVELFGF